MRPPKYNYTITDMTTVTLLLKNCDNDTARLAIGIPNEKISLYARERILWKGRYKITRTEIERPKPIPKPDIMDKYFCSNDRAFQKRFDDAMEYLREHYPPSRLRRIVFVEKVERVS
jgi:hypothetical protein